MSHVNIQAEKTNIDIVVLETPAKDFGWVVTTPQGGIEWDYTIIGKYEDQRGSFNWKSMNSSKTHVWHATSSYKYRTFWRYWLWIIESIEKVKWDDMVLVTFRNSRAGILRLWNLQ